MILIKKQDQLAFPQHVVVADEYRNAMAGDVPQAADPQNISLRGNGAGEGNKVWGFMENSTRPRHWAQCSTAVAPAHMAPTARLPARPRLSVVRPTVGSDGPKGTRGPSEARTARTVDVPNWPFTVQPLVRFHVLSLVDEPAEATSTTTPPDPGPEHTTNPHSPHEATHMRHRRKSVRQSGRQARRLSVQARSADLLRG